MGCLPPTQRRLPPVPLARALAQDLGFALRSGPIRLFLLLELLAGLVLLWRRGSDMLTTVLLVWVGLAVLAFFAWWAGRHRLAHPQPDEVPAAAARSLFALLGAAGLTIWGFGAALGLRWGMPAGLLLLACGMGGWLWGAWRTGGLRGVGSWLARDVRPFVPLLLLVGLPRLLAGGPLYLVGAAAALPSGIGQQLLYLVGLYAPLEAATRRAAASAVAAALVFALVHVPLVLEENQGDLLAGFANAMLFQAGVGLVACLAYQRHRAVVPIGVAHALAIG